MTYASQANEDRLASQLERDRGQFEVLIDWALDAGTDADELKACLSNPLAQLVDEAAS